MFEVRAEWSGSADQRRRESPWWGVHAARYAYASPLAAGRRVLDVACGTGYGLSILRAAGGRVVGLDADPLAVRKASGQGAERPSVLIANASHLPFGASVFDLVTSFETLEHLAERERFVTELRRVLTPDGLLVLSTPNANHTQPVHGRPRNPYHLHEYTPDELTRELALQFEQVELQGQTLHSRYKIPPFQDQQQKLSATPELLLQLFAWRVINKLPSALREWTSQTLWRRPFFPGETDYEFSPLTVDSAPVLVALCRPTRPIAPASGR